MSDFGKSNHPSNRRYFSKAKKEKPLPPLTAYKDYEAHKVPKDYSDVNNIAAIRAAEKHAHELDMIKALLTTILNNLDLQQRTMDEIYDMLDCYLVSGEDE